MSWKDYMKCIRLFEIWMAMEMGYEWVYVNIIQRNIHESIVFSFDILSNSLDSISNLNYFSHLTHLFYDFQWKKTVKSMRGIGDL